MMYDEVVLYKLLIVYGLIHVTQCVSCESSCDINADELVEWSTYFHGYQIWSNQVDHIATCARLCVRLTKCKSFNFERPTGNCELNSDVLERNPDGRVKRHGTVYSDIFNWPKEIDPDCYYKKDSSPPCKEDEVCVPGQLSDFLGSPRCMSAKPRCSSEWLVHKDACYLFSSSKKNWTLAAYGHCRTAQTSSWSHCDVFDSEHVVQYFILNTCEEQGSHLVRIESVHEQKFLEDLLLKNAQANQHIFWTDGNYVDVADKWVWGHPEVREIEETFWQSGEPNSPKEHCVGLYSIFKFKWADFECHRSCHFICEKAIVKDLNLL